MNESSTPLLFVSFSPTPARGGDDIAEMTTDGGKAPSSILLCFLHQYTAMPCPTRSPFVVLRHPQSRSNVAPNSFDDAYATAELQKPAERCTDVETQHRRAGYSTNFQHFGRCLRESAAFANPLDRGFRSGEPPTSKRPCFDAFSPTFFPAYTSLSLTFTRRSPQRT